MGASTHAQPGITAHRPVRAHEGAPAGRSHEWVVPILAVFVAAAIALGVFALRTAASANSLRHDVSSLRAELGGLQSRLAAEQRALVKTQKKLTALRGTSAKAASAGSVQRLSDTVDHLGVTVHMFEVCVPQLERELAGLRLVTGSVNGWLTNARLLAPAALSPACASALGR